MVKTVVDDPDTPSLPFGCISANALRTLAGSLDQLYYYHEQFGGDEKHLPCLRRIESSDGAIVAHVSVGPAVGGSWEKFTYDPKTNHWFLTL